MSTEYDPGDYNRSGMMAFMFSMIVTMLFFVYIAFIHQGVDLKEIPQQEVESAQVQDAAPAEAQSEETTEGE